MGDWRGNDRSGGLYVNVVKAGKKAQKGRFGVHRVRFILSSSEGVLKVGFHKSFKRALWALRWSLLATGLPFFWHQQEAILSSFLTVEKAEGEHVRVRGTTKKGPVDHFWPL